MSETATKTPSRAAMEAAVELEIIGCLGLVTTAEIGRIVQRAIDSSVSAELAEAHATIARLDSLVYVPGLWKCPKCKFGLCQMTLHANSGAVSARDDPGETCPNCRTPLWRVTERDGGNEAAHRCGEAIKEAATLRETIASMRRAAERLCGSATAFLRYFNPVDLPEDAGQQWHSLHDQLAFMRAALAPPAAEKERI